MPFVATSPRPEPECTTSREFDPRRSPDSLFCCLIRVAIARRIGGQWPSGLQPQFGDNALGDGQLFFDFRNDDVVKFWAEHVVMDAVNDYVDGVFTVRLSFES